MRIIFHYQGFPFSPTQHIYTHQRPDACNFKSVYLFTTLQSRSYMSIYIIKSPQKGTSTGWCVCVCVCDKIMKYQINSLVYIKYLLANIYTVDLWCVCLSVSVCVCGVCVCLSVCVCVCVCWWYMFCSLSSIGMPMDHLLIVWCILHSKAFPKGMFHSYRVFV